MKKKKSKKHFMSALDMSFGYKNAICGIRAKNITINKNEVTCKNCLKVLDSGSEEKEVGQQVSTLV